MLPTKKPQYDIATRAQVVALKEVGLSKEKITNITGVSRRQIQYLYAHALERGYNPAVSKVLKDEYFVDAPRAGRPKKATKEATLELLANVRKTRATRALTLIGLARIQSQKVSYMTIHRILRASGFKKVNPTRKPGLTPKMKEARLAFYLQYKDWTLEDWKNVIWSDETSVVFGQRRGGERVWRQAGEIAEPTVIRNRWKGYSEFMFWACFSYDKKGPCHVWKPETVAEKKAATIEIARLNEEAEPAMKMEWELATGIKRLNLRQKTPGKQPVWKFDKSHGAMARDGKGGVDWYRYRTFVLVPKLIPFAQECKKERPLTVVQEDGAASHISKHQAQLFVLADILKLLWPGNSPDLNMIEPCWPWMKRQTSQHRDFEQRGKLPKIWEDCWRI